MQLSTYLPRVSPIALRLRELRQKRGLTQVELSKLTGIDQGAISRIENGHTGGIEFDVLERLCDALNCQPWDLLKRQPTPRKRRRR